MKAVAGGVRKGSFVLLQVCWSIMSPVRDIPARVRQILAKPGLVVGADAAELRDLLSTVP